MGCGDRQIPATGGYNTYSVRRQGDGTYAVINSAAYAVNDAMRHTLYYTQRNQGKFILVETKAPAGYFGDWTDIKPPPARQERLGQARLFTSKSPKPTIMRCFGCTMPITTLTS